MSPPTPRDEGAEVCTYAECAEPATVELRFGDGSTRLGVRQTSVAYCPEHAAVVKRLFVTCDERLVRSQ